MSAPITTAGPMTSFRPNAGPTVTIHRVATESPAPADERPAPADERRETPAERVAANRTARLRAKRIGKRLRQGKKPGTIPPMPNWYRPSRKLLNTGDKGVIEALNRAAEHSSGHREELEASPFCACYYCCETYPPALITEWWDGGETPVCPRCGIDSVIGSNAGFPIDDIRFLFEMYDYWFGNTASARVNPEWRVDLRQGAGS